MGVTWALSGPKGEGTCGYHQPQHPTPPQDPTASGHQDPVLSWYQWDCPAPGARPAIKSCSGGCSDQKREKERWGWGWGRSPLVPDILFRVPIKDNVTCKTCKLLPSLWRPPGPHTPRSHPQLHSPASQAKGTTLGALGAQALRASAPSFPFSSAPPFLALGSAGRLCQARGRECAGADPCSCSGR